MAGNFLKLFVGLGFSIAPSPGNFYAYAHMTKKNNQKFETGFIFVKTAKNPWLCKNSSI